MMIENTTYSGAGKPVYDYFDPSTNKVLLDWKGHHLAKGEEYCCFSDDIIVNLDDVAEFLSDIDLEGKTLNQTLCILADVYEVYPEIIVK